MTWLLLHRFRVGWLERAEVTHGIDRAIAERRGVASTTGVDSTVGQTREES